MALLGNLGMLHELGVALLLGVSRKSFIGRLSRGEAPKERLAGSLETLQPIYREALVLRFQEELSLQEISGVVGAPVATVASRIYRGLRTLRSQLDGGKHEI